MTIFLTLTGLLILTFVLIKAVRTLQWGKEVKTLFSESEDISFNRFQYNILDGLPKPAQRYFRHVLKEGQPYISYVRLKHNGQFKTGHNKDWVPIRGEQYFTTQQPGFIWQGNTAMFSARDSYLSRKGRLSVFLFSAFRIAGGSGEKYDHGELLRWLAESIWFPTNLLPGKHLSWTPVDDYTADLHFNYNNFKLEYRVSFNDAGEITMFQTQRYMGENSLETWVGTVSDYREINGMLIPFSIEAAYKLKEGDYSYAKFKVSVIEYNIPEKFSD